VDVTCLIDEQLDAEGRRGEKRPAEVHIEKPGRSVEGCSGQGVEIEILRNEGRAHRAGIDRDARAFRLT
jgi:hypothetical protein